MDSIPSRYGGVCAPTAQTQSAEPAFTSAVTVAVKPANVSPFRVVQYSECMPPVSVAVCRPSKQREGRGERQRTPIPTLPTLGPRR